MQGCIAGWFGFSGKSKSGQASKKAGSSFRQMATWSLVGLGTACATTGLGCSREFYRRDADQEAARLVDEKKNDPRWNIPEQSVYGDSRSRYYDPNNPDCSPLPPDDPKSHELMHCVYGMKGYKRWHENGELNELENPAWRDFLTDYMERTDDGTYVMDLHDALQLALLNSRNYQTNVESLYLSALDVAFERFRFDVQFVAGAGLPALGNRTSWLHRGSEPSGDSSSTLTTVNGARASKLLPAGGQFLVDFANTFVWQFVGPNENTRADSLLSFTFLQPFLRQGGREVAMERLTLAERGLLANVRQMERYRQGFLIDVASGTGSVGGPSRQGGVFEGAGLSGFTGQGSGFAGVGEATQFARAGGGGGGGGSAGGGGGAGFAGGVAGNVGGFIGLAQLRQQVRNLQINLNLQLENLARMDELFAAGRIGSFQVDQFRQNVQTTRSQYLAALNNYQQQLESFMIGTLGLPPNLPVKIDESVVDPFQFTEPQLLRLRDDVKVVTERVRTVEDPTLDSIRQSLSELARLLESTGQRFGSVRADYQRLANMQDQRVRGLKNEQDRKEFLEQVSKLQEQFGSLERQYRAIVDDRKKLQDQLDPDKRKENYQQLVSQYEALSDLLLELGFSQAGARLETIILPTVKLDDEDAFRIARANRLDIMNQRAEVVDQWRLIAFNADRLEADLNVTLNGSIGTLDRNIAKFRDQNGSFSASVSFDTPITRVNERNIYRESLISYQRVRRGYIQFEDQVRLSLRSTLRSVDLFEQEIELRRQAMRIAIRQMDFNQARLKEPPRVGAAGGQQGDPVRDLLGAYSDYLNTQNGVMNTFLSFQALRMVLYRDLGIIRFDENGMWVDEPMEVALQRLESESEPFVPPAYPVVAQAMLDADGVPMEQEEPRPAPTVILSPAILTSPEDEPVRRTEASSDSVRRLTPPNKS